MTRLLIIGGTGFIGKSLLWKLKSEHTYNARFHEIIVIARRASALRQSNPELLDSRIKLIDADIATIGDVPDAEYTIHAAASSDAKSYLDPLRNEADNVLKTVDNYLNIIKKYRKKTKLLYLSSGAVYGKIKSVNDTIPCHPNELLEHRENIKQLSLNKINYAISKLEAEQRIFNSFTSRDKFIIARCFSFIGEYLPFDTHFAIGNFISDILNLRPITLKAENQVIRSYMDADDLADVLLKLLLNDAPNSNIYNVGSDEAVELGDLVKRLSVVYSLPIIIGQRSSEQDFYVPNIDSIKNDLNITRLTKIEKSINDVIIKHARTKFINS
jgi:nucleoside-diphosphate-sugar epimerase